MFSTSGWSLDYPEKYVDTIMQPKPGVAIPLPHKMNIGINEISSLIEIRNLEKTNGMTTGDYKKLFNLANQKIQLVIAQMENEKAPGYCEERKNLLRRYESQIKSKFENQTISINTIIILGIRLCFFADFCRIDVSENLQAKIDIAEYVDPYLHNLFSLAGINKFRTENGASPLGHYGFVATRPFEMLEEHMCALPIIPFITKDAQFGVNTYLYALAKGYIILGFPVNNTSSAHQGMMRSFKSVHEFLALTGTPQKPLAAHQLTFNSSLMGLSHDLVHLQGIRNIINPALQYYEFYQKHGINLPNYDNTRAIADAKKVINCYRNIYIELIKNWEILEKPEAVALLIYWLVHESAYGERKGENHTADELIIAALSGVTRREITLADYQFQETDERQLQRNIHRAIIVNEFDFAEELNKRGFKIEINEENPYITLAGMRGVFLEAYEASPQIKKLLNEINEDQENFYGVALKRCFAR